MGVEGYFLIVGAVLLLMAVSGSLLQRLPLTTGLVYMAIGIGLGPQMAGVIDVNLIDQPGLVEHIAEIAVLISLFTAGLKLRLPFTDARWRAPVRLATVGMVLTAAGVASAGVLLLGLAWPTAVMLGAMLAPTDPVLASDVQVNQPGDRDRVRFALTGEAGLNDGTAFPLLMLGLGWAGHYHLGDWGWRWLAFDVLWASAAGIGIGALLGQSVGRFVVYLRREHKEAVGLDDFLALGLVASSYGLALLLHGYGFLAVFAAGLALRHVERVATSASTAANDPATDSGPDADHVNAHSEHASELTQAVLTFNEQMERIGEVVVVVLVGTLLTASMFSPLTLAFSLAVFVLVRPAAVYLTTRGIGLGRLQRRLLAWFGVRGAGSVFYLAYAATHGTPATEVARLAGLVLPTIALSVVLHGVSVTPLMNMYQRRMQRAAMKAKSRG